MYKIEKKIEQLFCTYVTEIICLEWRKLCLFSTQLTNPMYFIHKVKKNQLFKNR